MKSKAYGKINLMLNISGVREDGYHTLETVMQTVSLYDLVEITLKKEKTICLKCSLPYIPCDERNIAYKAAALFFDAVGYHGGADISIKKNIPVGGGMGGGSTDAAAVISMLDAMLESKMPAGEMEKLALSLGADVPFCLKKGTYLAEGIGEILTRLPDMPKCSIVLCKPKVSVSSKNAYGIYDRYPQKLNYDFKIMKSALEKGDLRDVCSALGNSFEPAISESYPAIAEARSRLERSGACGCAMTGSGAVVFGIYKDVYKAQKTRAALRISGYRAYCVSPVSSEGRKR